MLVIISISMHRCELTVKNLGSFAIVRFDTSLQRDCVKLLTNKSHVRFNLVLLHTDIGWVLIAQKLPSKEYFRLKRVD